MFNFEKRDDGVFVRDEEGRAIAHVEMQDLDREEWAIHFTGTKMTPPELRIFLEQLAALPRR